MEHLSAAQKTNHKSYMSSSSPRYCMSSPLKAWWCMDSLRARWRWADKYRKAKWFMGGRCRRSIPHLMQSPPRQLWPAMSACSCNVLFPNEICTQWVWWCFCLSSYCSMPMISPIFRCPRASTALLMLAWLAIFLLLVCIEIHYKCYRQFVNLNWCAAFLFSSLFLLFTIFYVRVEEAHKPIITDIDWIFTF